MDDVQLNVTNTLPDYVDFGYQYNECFNCQMLNLTIENKTSSILHICPDWPIQINTLLTGDNDTICRCNKRLQYNVQYDYVIQRRYDSEYTYFCTLTGGSSNLQYYTPLIVLIVAIILVLCLYNVILLLYKRRILQSLAAKLYHYQVDSFEDLGRPDSISCVSEDELSLVQDKVRSSVMSLTKSNTVIRKRVKSVDTLRGFSLIIMVFVNYGGGGYWFFKHSVWNGLTVADLVFPWFLFVMGVTISITQIRNIRNSLVPFYWLKCWLSSVRRSIILFAFGLMLNSFKSNMKLTNLRIMGVLQRLAIAYFVTFTLFVIISPIQKLSNKIRLSSTNHLDTLISDDEEDENNVSLSSNTNIMGSNQSITPKMSFWKRWHIIKKASITDLRIIWPYLVISICLLFIHGCISKLLRDPTPDYNCPKGYLGPGGIGDYGQYPNCTGGIARYIDVQVLGSSHMYQHPTVKKLYHTNVPYDPEGILGNLTSIALCIIGLICGNIVMNGNSIKSVMSKLGICSVVCICVGIGLCEGRTNDVFIPINKNLWSISYVLITGGMAIFLLMILFIIIDIMDMWNGGPFYFVGMNSIVIYIGHELLSSTFPVQWQVPNNHGDQLAMDCWGAVFWVIIAGLMHYKRIYVSI